MLPTNNCLSSSDITAINDIEKLLKQLQLNAHSQFY